MRLIVTQIDITKTRANWPNDKFAPAFLYERSADHDLLPWLVADSPIPIDLIDEAAAKNCSIGDVAIDWANTATDEYVRIPLFSYDIQPHGDLALAFMFQLGVLCSRLIAPKIGALHVISGAPVELVYRADGSLNHMTYWFGFAVALERSNG